MGRAEYIAEAIGCLFLDLYFDGCRGPIAVSHAALLLQLSSRLKTLRSLTLGDEQGSLSVNHSAVWHK